MDEQRKLFLEMETAPGEDGVCEDCYNNNEGFRYYLNLVDKAVAGFERIDSFF